MLSHSPSSHVTSATHLLEEEMMGNAPEKSLVFLQHLRNFPWLHRGHMNLQVVPRESSVPQDSELGDGTIPPVSTLPYKHNVICFNHSIASQRSKCKAVLRSCWDWGWAERRVATENCCRNGTRHSQRRWLLILCEMEYFLMRYH